MVVGPLGESRRAIDLARAAESAGFALLGFGDNQTLWRDVYVSLALAAQATTSLRLGPTVTNVVTRDLAVTAGAIATLDELGSGRAFLGLGPGDSAVYSAGARPARMDDVESAIHTVRRLRPSWARRQAPIYVPAEGPKGLALAGRVADGALVSFGLCEPEIREARRRIAEAAESAGRQAEDIDVWFSARVTLGSTTDEAMARARSGMAAVAHHALRIPARAIGIPPELVEPLERLNAGYRTSEHAAAGATHNAELVERLGLMPFLTERYGLVGTAADCAARVGELMRAGVDRLLLMFSGEDLVDQVTRWRDEVMPAVTT